jgi:hypothetical protein
VKRDQGSPRDRHTFTISLTATSLSCLGDGFDDEAVDVENSPEKRENSLRDIMVFVARWQDGESLLTAEVNMWSPEGNHVTVAQAARSARPAPLAYMYVVRMDVTHGPKIV